GAAAGVHAAGPVVVRAGAALTASPDDEVARPVAVYVGDPGEGRAEHADVVGPLDAVEEAAVGPAEDVDPALRRERDRFEGGPHGEVGGAVAVHVVEPGDGEVGVVAEPPERRAGGGGHGVAVGAGA